MKYIKPSVTIDDTLKNVTWNCVELKSYIRIVVLLVQFTSNYRGALSIVRDTNWAQLFLCEIGKKIKSSLKISKVATSTDQMLWAWLIYRLFSLQFEMSLLSVLKRHESKLLSEVT